jgi:Uma2 family endonuclease
MSRTASLKFRVTSPKFRFTAREYEKMCDAGVFGDRRVELINGRIYRMAAQRDPHMIAISKTISALNRVVSASEWLIVQGTLRLDEFNEPDPDFLWVDAPIGTPESQRPLPMLVIEVSHTSYRKDSGAKLRMYAQHGIRDYWILNLRDDRVEVYRDPQNPTGIPEDCSYASIHYFTRGQSIAPLARPQILLAVDDLLP